MKEFYTVEAPAPPPVVVVDPIISNLQSQLQQLKRDQATISEQMNTTTDWWYVPILQSQLQNLVYREIAIVQQITARQAALATPPAPAPPPLTFTPVPVPVIPIPAPTFAPITSAISLSTGPKLNSFEIKAPSLATPSPVTDSFQIPWIGLAFIVLLMLAFGSFIVFRS